MEIQLDDVTVSVLPDDCLRAIFLRVPILQRIQLRKVCKRWKKISDDCWRHVRVIIVSNPISSGRNQVEGYGADIEVRAVKAKFANSFIKRSAKFLTTIKDRRASQTFSILPAVKSCYRLEKLEIKLNSVEDDKRLSNLFTINRRIRCLHIIIVAKEKHTYDCLNKLRTDCLAELSILIEGSAERGSKTLCTNMRQLIDDCRALNKLTIQVEGDGVLEAVGNRVNLEYLDVKVFYSDTDSLHNIAKLCNLRSLEIYRFGFEDAVITDELLENISENCGQLEFVSLRHCREVTDSGLLALSRLPKLKELEIKIAPVITDKYLSHFSNIERLYISCSSISDPGVIALLRNSSRLNFLNLSPSKMTIASVRATVEETRNRENGIPLVLCLSGMDMDLSEFSELPPLLRIV